MNNLELIGTDNTPKVILNEELNIYLFTGKSLPEDANEFFKPIKKWFSMFEPKRKAVFEFKFDYLNTASSKLILDIFFIIEKLHQKGFDVYVIWYHLEDDEDMKEIGEEYSDLVALNFEIISMN